MTDAPTVDHLTVACHDCGVPAGQPCRTRVRDDDGHPAPHRVRQNAALLASVERGTCALCTRPLARGPRPATGEDHAVWHPDPRDAERCPVLPDPATEWNAYAAALTAGARPGYPGEDAFVPDLADPGNVEASPADGGAS